jgi:hypothetical protein
MQLSHWGEARFLLEALFTVKQLVEDSAFASYGKAEIHQRLLRVGLRIQLALLASFRSAAHVAAVHGVFRAPVQQGFINPARTPGSGA